MFVDSVKFDIKAGKGGDGMVGWRREKYVPNGGPAGGDGGHGGNVIFKVDPGMSTLMDFKYRKKFKAENGGDGGNKKMTGASADDLVIKVPEGTTVYNADTDEAIVDLTDKRQEAVVAKGGRGGRGNVHFATAKNSAPEIAENGEPGEEFNVRLELRLLADVGLVGFPSSGKSTLLAAITSAKPKVASYPFTTLKPNLGIVKNDDGNDFVIADLPGLIKGASEGVGLGFEFLRHIQRTRVLWHVVDMSALNGQDPYEAFQQINEELGNFDEKLLERPQIVVASKMDLPEAEKNFEKFQQELQQHGDAGVKAAVPISAVTHKGTTQLIRETAELLETAPAFPLLGAASNEGEVKYQADFAPEFEIHNDGKDSWIITGDKVERLVAMTNTEHDQGVLRLARKLHGMGVDQALRDAGVKDGDSVTIGSYTFNYVN